jgi:hypothetical protein
VLRYLEAYLFWLFGWTLFCNSTGNYVDKVLMQYARAFADAEPGQVPGWSWESAVLAATYRGLCEACLKTERTAVITGFPLLLQLWSYKRFSIARPLISEEPYPPEMYGMWDEDSPTIGSLWTDRRVSSFKLFNLLLYVSVCEEYRCSCIIFADELGTSAGPKSIPYVRVRI